MPRETHAALIRGGQMADREEATRPDVSAGGRPTIRGPPRALRQPDDLDRERAGKQARVEREHPIEGPALVEPEHRTLGPGWSELHLLR